MQWLHRFRLKDLLSTEDKAPAACAALGQEVIRRLKARPIFEYYQGDLEEQFDDVQDQDDFNSALEDLYDAADDLRIWVE